MSTSDKVTNKGDPNIAEIGNNSEAFERAFNAALRVQSELNEERAKLNARASKIRKGFKADGIQLGKLDATLAMMTWSPSEVREHFATLHNYARLARLPVGTQLDLLADTPEEEVSVADWTSRGFSAATTGKGVPGVPPKEAPPEMHQAWLAGWTDGQYKNAPGKLKIVE